MTILKLISLKCEDEKRVSYSSLSNEVKRRLLRDAHTEHLEISVSGSLTIDMKELETSVNIR